MTTPNDNKDIRVPDAPPALPANLEDASLNQVLTRVLRNSWVQALREMESEKAAALGRPKELELRDLVFLFLKRSWILAICVGIAAWIGHTKAEKLPDLYESTALLVPTAAELVRSANSQGGSGDASPDLALYQALMTSRTVLVQVLKAPVLRTHSDTSPVPYASMIGVDTASPAQMQGATQGLANSISLLDGGEGIFKLSFVSTDSFVAPQMADIIMTATQKELYRVRTEKISSILAQLEQSARAAYIKYRAAAARAGRFMDQNLEMESGSLQVKRAELEAELKMREEAYTLARQRADQIRLELDQVYPPAVVFDPASRPATLIGPDRKQKTMLAGFIGLVLGIVLVLAWEFLFKSRKA